jgi:hypothetical protein
MVRRGTFTRRSKAAQVYLWSLQLVRFPQWGRRQLPEFRRQDRARYRQRHEAINSEKGQPFDPTPEQKKVF